MVIDNASTRIMDNASLHVLSKLKMDTRALSVPMALSDKYLTGLFTICSSITPSEN